MAKRSLSGSIALTKLAHVRMKKKGKSGEVEGIFIPIKQNMLIEGKENEGVIPVYMNLDVQIFAEKNQHDQIGMMSKRVDKKFFGDKKYADRSEEEKELTNKMQPILGNLIEFTSNPSANDTAGDVGAGQVYSDDDDLPF